MKRIRDWFPVLPSTIAFCQCMGCGACVPHCASAAITLHRAPGKGDPLDLELRLTCSNEAPLNTDEVPTP